MSQENNNGGQNHDTKNDDTGIELTPEQQKAQEEAEEFILNFKDEDLKDDEKVKSLETALKSAKTTVAQKRHFREKLAQATEAKAPEQGSKATEVKTEKQEDNSSSIIVDLRMDNPWMTKDVAAEIVRISKANNESVEATLKRPYISKWLSEEKSSKEVEQASISSSSKAGSGGASQRDWSTATPEEMEKERARIMSMGN